MENLRCRLDVVGVASQERIGTAAEKEEINSQHWLFAARQMDQRGVVKVTPSKAKQGQEKAPGTKEGKMNVKETEHDEW